MNDKKPLKKVPSLSGRGRKTVYTPSVVNKIMNAIKRNKGISGACDVAGISYTTFRKWRVRYPSFNRKVDEAEVEAVERGKTLAQKSVFKGMLDDWKAGAWYLERTDDRFKPPQKDNKMEGGVVVNIINFTKKEKGKTKELADVKVIEGEAVS